MTVKLTIIGLGRIGASMGLALAEQTQQLTRVGHDKDTIAARQAEKKGAIDKLETNLHKAVDDADIVVLALPVDEVRGVLEEIAGDLKPEAVVINTTPANEAVTGWAQELLPEERYFITFTPTLNPAYLLETGSGLDAAHDDLFKNSQVLIGAPFGTGQDAIKLGSDLAALLGARPLFSDAIEADGLLAGGNLLPQLAAAALVNATTGQPGWAEVRKVAGRCYALGSEPVVHLDDSDRLGQSALLNRGNAVRVMDNLILALRELRDAIAEGDEQQLNDLLENARTQRDRWLDERSASAWDTLPKTEMPSKGEYVGRFFGLGALRSLRGKEDPEGKQGSEGKGKKKK